MIQDSYTLYDDSRLTRHGCFTMFALIHLFFVKSETESVAESVWLVERWRETVWLSMLKLHLKGDIWKVCDGVLRAVFDIKMWSLSNLLKMFWLEKSKFASAKQGAQLDCIKIIENTFAFKVISMTQKFLHKIFFPALNSASPSSPFQQPKKLFYRLNIKNII